MQQLHARMLYFSALVVLMAVACGLTYAQEIGVTPEQLEFFEKDVRPILAEHCYACHSARAEKLKAGLKVDSRIGLLDGGDSGPSIVPGDANASLLIAAVRYENFEMPPQGKLSEKDIQILERWVELGASWPEEPLPDKQSTSQATFDLKQREREHWVWQPISNPAIPANADPSWAWDDIDRFVLAELEQARLRPAVDADKTALLRRLYFDLIGMPPTPEQMNRFLADMSADATERVVDELLDSPHFGERWGRHWLDLVRYAESRGHEFDNDAANAFQYRDYIIRALNADVPYDQLVREHIAGDLLDQPRLHATQGFNESILGTGFWFLGEWVHSPVDIRKDETDRFDNMIDVMSKTFLGVTVSCARCHDHKFDAISMADYYALSGFLQSSDYRQVPFESLEHNRRIAQELGNLDTKFRQQVSAALEKAGLLVPAAPPLPTAAAPFIAIDYATLPTGDFLQDGFIFGDRPRWMGEAMLDINSENHLRFVEAGAAVSDSFWNGLESISERGASDKSKLAKMPRSGRTLRTPTFTLTDGQVACRVRGAGHVVACVDSHRLIAGPLHGQTVVDIKADKPWVELDLTRYVGHRLHLEFTPGADAQLEVFLVTQGATQEIRAQLDQRQAAMAESVAKFAASATQALSTHGPQLVHAWANERRQLQQRVMRRSQLAMAMMDGTGEDDRILIRGSAANPGDVEPRHFLTAISGNQPLEIKSGSGRLELAQQINAGANPLTARVIVNRLWHYLLGRGIVPTTDDFGVLGQRPTHPALLDHLATRFVAGGQSIKHLIRAIVLTRTYQMSSRPNAAALATDPNNNLWHYRPPKRLEGEVIRDSLLSLSGQIDLIQFGEPVPIYLSPFMDGRGRPEKSGPLDGARRRSIYTAVRRNFLSPFMLAFDTPAPFSTMGRRNVSNVPAQALILMNDPFVVEQARNWGERAVMHSNETRARVAWMYHSAFTREPTESEAAAAVKFIDTECQNRNCAEADHSVWADLAHALINTKEFIFLR